MTCFHPIKVYRHLSDHDPVTGKWPIRFEKHAHHSHAVCEFEVPCGKCYGCRMARAREWALRLYLESIYYDDKCFVTMTYDDDHLPADGNLSKVHCQKFIKRLRKSIGIPVRYFLCGEYGSTTFRPHYHMILLGYEFPDLFRYNETESGTLYTSELCDRLWSLGECKIGLVTEASIGYTTAYCNKKLGYTMADYERAGIQPEFVLMSTRPAIGSQFWIDNRNSLMELDGMFMKDGVRVSLPRIFNKRWQAEFAESYDKVKLQRMLKMYDRRTKLFNDKERQQYQTITNGLKKISNYFDLKLLEHARGAIIDSRNRAVRRAKEATALSLAGLYSNRSKL